MKRIETEHPDVLEYREPNSWWLILTVPLSLVGLAAGVFFAVGGVYFFCAMASEAGEINPVALIVGGLIGLVWLLKSVEIFGMIERALFRVGVVVDRRRHVAVKGYGLFVPLSIAEYDLNVYDGLQVVQETTRYRSSFSYRYLLYLEGPGGRRVLIGRSEHSADITAMKYDLMAFVKAGPVRCLEAAAV